jgi:peptidoglycan/LPS O-acetylase OafA/YrhL
MNDSSEMCLTAPQPTCQSPALAPLRISAASASSPSERFTFVDGLRGFAALWVAGFHFYGGLTEQASVQLFPEPIHGFFKHGNCGVEVFFVISGFVIAYSVRSVLITARYCGQFMLRRSLRLEPPYWATIAAAIAVLWLKQRLEHRAATELPSWTQVLAHVFYLQDLLGYEQIVEVFWTLCMEVQFYLTFLLLLYATHWSSAKLHLSPAGQRCALMLWLLPLSVYSMGVLTGLLRSPHNALMIKFWYLFQLGALIWWVLGGVLRDRCFWLYLAVLCGLWVYSPTWPCAIGIITGAALYGVGKIGQLARWLDYRPLQYCGRISYSVYLIHAVVGTPFTYYIAKWLLGGTPSLGASVLLLGAALAVTLVCADLLHRLVERPSTELSRRLKGQTRTGLVS